MSERLRDALGDLAAAALGLVAFLVLVGWTTLIPTNIAWLSFADRGMHMLGWMFYRQAPWAIPPGLNPHLGIELSNSIGLVDGLPLFALPLKLISNWLPQPFQYWGLWLLLSFVLQALFAYHIARELNASRLVSLVAAAFALITPALMFRVEMHLALSGHWTVLAALYLYVRRDPPKPWMWPLLAAMTAAIHAYLLAMVFALWFAAAVERLWSKRMAWIGALTEALAIFAFVPAVLWAAGFFVTPSVGTYGYGDYKLNLLWPIIPYKGWSQLVPDIPHAGYDYEGLSFLGIGILALLVIAVSGAVRNLGAVVTRRWLPLALMLVALMLFAVTTKVQLGPWQLFNLQLPKSIVDLFSTFRSTGRFNWPLLYFVTIGIVVLIGRKWRNAVAVPLLLAAFAAQAWDSGPGLLQFHTYLAPPAPTWDTPLTSPFWDRAAAAGYNRVRVWPIMQPGVEWRWLGYYAVTHGMDIDSAYLGRTDVTAMNALIARETEVLTTGKFEPRTIYVLDPKAAATVSAHATPDDLLTVVDKHIVFVRNGATLVDGLGIPPHEVFG